ncbi:MAG: M55 family metallopeptidase [Phycisphaerae bacterium]
MKFMIGVDLEGVAAVVGNPGKSLSTSNDYPFACLQGAREADAAAKGFFDAGAEEVVIWDNHAARPNLDYDRIDPRCDLIIGGSVPHRFPTLDETYAGIALIGYHAMDTTAQAVLAHSFSSVDIQEMTINGQTIGEIEVEAAVAGTFGVPLVLLSSDDKAVAATRSRMDWVQTVVTKQSLGWNACRSKHPARVVEEIRTAARTATENLGRMRTFAFDTPMEFRIRFKRIDKAEQFACRGQPWRRVDAYTVGRTMEAITDYF